MKKILSFLIIMLAAVISYSQTPAPGIFNYQGVARNSVGNALVNKTINLRLTIHDGAAAGPVVYQESRLATTNPFGLFNVQVGSPGFLTQVGSVAAVNWGVNSKFIQVEIDPNGGTSFINVGTAQIASVPYALYSSLSNDLVLPFIKTQSAPASTLIGITNSATTGSQGAIMGTSASTDANAFAITGTISSAAPGGFSTGVRGINNGTGGLGIGVWGSQNGSGWGVYGTSVSGIGGNFSGGNGIGVFGSATTGTGGRFTSATGLALHTSGGGVRLQNINEAANRILATIPGNGDATWQDPSAVGIITGSGTLNFVPKWTPNGTNLGNSQIFDNGTNIGIGTITPTAKFSINELFKVTATGTVQYANSVNPMMIMFESGTANADRMVIGHSPAFPTWGLQYQDPPDKFNFLSGGTAVLTADLGTQRVGVGTSSPLQKLHVNSGTSFSTQLLEARDAANAGPHLQFLSGGESAFIDFIRSDYSTGGLAHRQGAMELRGGTRLNFHPNVGLVGPTDLAMTIIGNNNVGIGVTTPTSKLHIVNNSAGALNTVFVNQTGAGNVLNAVNVFEANTSNGVYGNAAIQALRGGGSLGNTFLWGAVTALEGIAATGGQGFGVQGTTEDGVGVAGLATNGTGVLGTNTNTGSAGHFENFFNTSNASPVVEVINISTVGSAFGVRSTISNTNPGSFSAAIRGQNNGTGGLGIGVWGSQYGAGWGMFGETVDGVGVYGASYNNGTAVNAWSAGGIGVYGRSDNNISGYFQNINPANGYPTLFSTTNGGGVAVQGSTSGTSSAGWFDIFNPASTAPAVYGATDGIGNAGFFWNINAANAISTVRAVNPSANINAIGVHAISGGGSGYGPLFASGMIAESFSQRGILGVSNANVAVHGASNTSIGVLGESYASTGNAGVFGSGLAVNNYGVVGNAAAGTGAGGYFTGGTTALRTLGGVQLTGIGEAPNRILATVPGTGQATWEDPAGLLGSLFWSTTGNSGTVDGTNFIGTTDAVPFNIRVVNTEAGRIDLNANTSYGLFSLSASTNAILYNTAYGYNSLPSTTTGDQNVGIGVQASLFNTTGRANTSIGVGTNQSNITGFQNTALGNFAMWQNTSSENTALGTQSLNNNTTGSQNTGVGQYALAFNDNGNSNTALGYFATVTAPGLNNATAIGANALVSASNSMVLGNGANIGIGISAPIARLHVENTSAGVGAIRAYQPNEADLPTIRSYGGGVIINDVSVIGGVPFRNSAVFAQSGNFAVGSMQKVNGNPDAIYATGLGPNDGIEVSVQDGYGVASTIRGTGTALLGWDPLGTGTALRTIGSVRMENIGEANGYVLTSDAVGNATWQGPASFRVRNFSVPVALPFFTYVTINQWATIDYENGSIGNYNPVTGDYTIPQNGTYHIDAQIGLLSPGATGSGYSGIDIFVNGVQQVYGLNSLYAMGAGTGIRVSSDLVLAAGDLVSIKVFHNTAGVVASDGTPNHSYFSVHKVK